VDIKEMVHRIFKAIVPHTNKRNLELTLLQQINTLQTLRYLVDGGMDDRMPCYSTRSIFMPFITTSRLRSLLSGWCVNDYSLSIHHLNGISDQLQVEAAGFISTNIETTGLFEDITKAYSSYYSFEQALLETRVHFYENMSYTVFKPDGDYHTVKLKVGEIVEVTRYDESELTFGKIMSIIEHSWNDNQEYVFLCFDWLEDLNKWDSLLDCQVYHIQHNSLSRVHPISTVLQSSGIPFIHYCDSNCSFQRHDTTNAEYI
ncbi:16006_t:CDS:2, partial [Racocetra persica]